MITLLQLFLRLFLSRASYAFTHFRISREMHENLESIHRIKFHSRSTYYEKLGIPIIMKI